MTVLDKSKRQKAIDFLYKEWDEKFKAYILGMRDAKDMVGLFGRRSALDGSPPKYWITPIHHGLGTSIRNLLRGNGFGEKDLGIENLDDYYEDLVDGVLERFIREADK
jgi:hypothetical protein